VALRVLTKEQTAWAAQILGNKYNAQDVADALFVNTKTIYRAFKHYGLKPKGHKKSLIYKAGETK
jgi:hypothetical protein